MTTPYRQLGVIPESRWPGLPPAIPLHYDCTTGLKAIYSGAGIITGGCVRNKAALNANPFTVLDGTDASGALIYSQQVGAAGNGVFSMPVSGVAVQNGVYVTDPANATEGVIWFIPL